MKESDNPFSQQDHEDHKERRGAKNEKKTGAYQAREDAGGTLLSPPDSIGMLAFYLRESAACPP